MDIEYIITTAASALGASRRRSRRATTRDSSPANARTAMGTISRNFSWSEFEDSPTAKAKGIPTGWTVQTASA